MARIPQPLAASAVSIVARFDHPCATGSEARARAALATSSRPTRTTGRDFLGWLDETGTAKAAVRFGLVITTLLTPFYLVTLSDARAQMLVGPGSIVNYSAGGSGSSGTPGAAGKASYTGGGDGNPGASGGPGPSSSIDVVSGTAITASSGIAALVIANGGPGGAGGAGDTKFRGQTGNGGGGGGGGAGGSIDWTLGTNTSVNTPTDQAIVLSADGGAGGDGGKAADSGLGGLGGAAGGGGVCSL